MRSARTADSCTSAAVPATKPPAMVREETPPYDVRRPGKDAGNPPPVPPVPIPPAVVASVSLRTTLRASENAPAVRVVELPPGEPAPCVMECPDMSGFILVGVRAASPVADLVALGSLLRDYEVRVNEPEAVIAQAHWFTVRADSHHADT